MGMSYRIAFDVTDPVTGLQRPVDMSGGLWHGDALLAEEAVDCCLRPA